MWEGPTNTVERLAWETAGCPDERAWLRLKWRKNPLRTRTFKSGSLKAVVRTRVPEIDDIQGVSVTLVDVETDTKIKIDFEQATELADLIKEHLKTISPERQIERNADKRKARNRV